MINKEQDMRFFIFFSLLVLMVPQLYAQTAFSVFNKTTGDTLLNMDNDGNLGLRVP
jgi:hypothetical protein